MTNDRVGRVRWRDAIMSRAFPPSLRYLRATLLCVVPIMTSDGVLEVQRDRIVDAVALPARTVEYHLQKAAEHGWLDRTRPGGNGRLARYQATVPDQELPATDCAQQPGVARNGLVCNSAEVARNVVAGSIRHRASLGEHEALDQDRQRRGDHDGARAEPDQRRDERRSDDEVTAHSAAAAVSPRAVTNFSFEPGRSPDPPVDLFLSPSCGGTGTSPGRSEPGAGPCGKKAVDRKRSTGGSGCLADPKTGFLSTSPSAEPASIACSSPLSIGLDMTAPSSRFMTAGLAAALASLTLSERRVFLRLASERAPGSLLGVLYRGLAVEVLADLEREGEAFDALTADLDAGLAAERQIRSGIRAVMRDGSIMGQDPDSGQWYPRID